MVLSCFRWLVVCLCSSMAYPGGLSPSRGLAEPISPAHHAIRVSDVRTFVEVAWRNFRQGASKLDSINSIHPHMSPYSRLLHPSSYPSGRDRPEITTTVPPKPSLTPSPPRLASFGTVRDDSRKALRQLANSGPKTVVPVPKRH